MRTPWRTTSGLANVRVPVAIDLSVLHWPSPVDVANPASLLAILCINVLHISPWHVSEHLLAGAPHLLRPEGRLFVYGAFKRGGAHTAPSNAAFDRALRAYDPTWGVRDLEAVVACATAHGLDLADVLPMPANNLSLILRRASPAP